ncbi:MAG: ATP-binding protein [Ilumatobacteraceae bacterium]|jgi:signal transduction histidine kinase
MVTNPATRLRLGIRLRMVLYFGLAALVAAVTLGLATYLSTRAYLLDQRIDVAKRQAFNNAQFVRTVLATSKDDIAGLVTNLRTERDGYAVLHLEATDSETEFFYAQEPLRFTQSNLPAELVTATIGGATGRQRFTFDEQPYEAVGVAIPALGVHYFEAFPLSQVSSTLATIQTTLIISVVTITVLGGVLGFTMSRSVLRPLLRVSNAANGIATGGLDTRLESEGDPDLDQIVRSFNDMADSVQSRIEREERFASDVSHELRSPITALSTAVDVLERRSAEFSERNQEAIAILAKQVRRFDRTVLDLLELARLDAGSSVSHVEEIDLLDTVRRVMARYEFQHVPLDVRGDEWSLLADRRRIERILANLLQNARDHAGGATLVTLSADDDELELAVVDAGPGIATSERQRIFERFARGTAGRTSAGSGLGLAIVQEHARAMGGRVWAEDSPDGGARFVVKIPRGMT